MLSATFPRSRPAPKSWALHGVRAPSPLPRGRRQHHCRDELCLDDTTIDVLDGAGGVDGGGPDAAGLGLVPVEGGEGSREFGGGLAVVEDGAELGWRRRGGEVVERGAPDAEGVGGGGEEGGRGGRAGSKARRETRLWVSSGKLSEVRTSARGRRRAHRSSAGARR
jgi:hypothetical protein